MININFDLSAILAKFDKIKVTAEESIRPAAQAGAQVFYDEVKLRAKRGNEIRHLTGKRTRPAGLLSDSIYKVYSKDNSGKDQATFHVSWSKKRAPHGYLVEYGTSRAPKAPFLRPSFDTMHAVAEAAINAELQKHLKGAL